MTPSWPSLTAAQMAEVDRLMIEEYGILLIQMMENAGRNLAEMARLMLGEQLTGRHIVVLCGAGNNGGGGMAAARHLHNRSAVVRIKFVGDPARRTDVSAHQWRILQAMGLANNDEPDLARADLIVDALIGYGLTGNAHGPVAEWIVRANTANCVILSLDTPSGLDTTTGVPGNPCIRASATLTLALPKAGLLQLNARQFVGDLYLADISVPPELYRQIGVEVGPLFTNATIIQVHR